MAATAAPMPAAKKTTPTPTTPPVATPTALTNATTATQMNTTAASPRTKRWGQSAQANTTTTGTAAAPVIMPPANGRGRGRMASFATTAMNQAMTTQDLEFMLGFLMAALPDLNQTLVAQNYVLR